MLAALAKTGNVTQAARAAKVGRATHYEWLAEDPEYASAAAGAMEEAADLLEAEAQRRAVTGVLEPVFHQGKKVATVRKYSDTLLIFLLKGAKPEKYKERTELSGRLDLSRLSDEQLEAISRGQGGGRT